MNGLSDDAERTAAHAPLDGSGAFRLCALAWAWGWGISAGIGLGVAVTAMIRDREMAPAAAFDLFALATAVSACLVLPVALLGRVHKLKRNRVEFSDAGVCALGVVAALPIQLLLCGGRGEMLAFWALGMSMAIGQIAFPLYQRLTGITSWHHQYKDLAQPTPRLLGWREILLLAGYMASYLFSVFPGFMAGGYLVEWTSHGTLSPRAFDFWPGIAPIVGGFALWELAFALKRHFPGERPWKLIACFSVPVLAFAAAMIRFGWGLFRRGLLWEACALAVLALYLFGMSLVDNTAAKPRSKDNEHDPSA